MIQTERLLLRPARPDDVAGMHEILSNEDAMRYWATPPHSDTRQTHGWIADMIAAAINGSEDYIVEIDGHVAGKVGAYHLPEFGYILHPRYWGKGLAREAVTAFLTHVHRHRPDIIRLNADIDPRNTASIKLVERLGFLRVGAAERTYHTHIGWCDSVYYSIDRAALGQLAISTD